MDILPNPLTLPQTIQAAPVAQTSLKVQLIQTPFQTALSMDVKFQLMPFPMAVVWAEKCL